MVTGSVGNEMTKSLMHCGKLVLLFICLLRFPGKDASKSSDEGNEDDELRQALLLVDLLKSEYVRILRENAVLKQGILREGNVTEDVDNSTCPAAAITTQDGTNARQSIDGVGTTSPTMWPPYSRRLGRISSNTEHDTRPSGHFRRRLRPEYPFYGLYGRRIMPDYNYYGKIRRDYGDYFGPQPNDTKRPTKSTTASTLRTSTITETEPSTASQSKPDLTENSTVPEREVMVALNSSVTNDSIDTTADLDTSPKLVTKATGHQASTSNKQSSSPLKVSDSAGLTESTKKPKNTLKKIYNAHPKNQNTDGTELKQKPRNNAQQITTEINFHSSATGNGDVNFKFAGKSKTPDKVLSLTKTTKGITTSTSKQNVKPKLLAKKANDVDSLKHIKKTIKKKIKNLI